MAMATWTGKLSVGVESIDVQHRVLFDTINDLHAAMTKGQTRAEIRTLLCTLLAYTRQHFATEEKMLTAAICPGLTQHRIKHRALAKQFEEYVARYQRGDTTLRNDFAAFFSDWLNAHIQKVDQPCRHFLNERAGFPPVARFEQRVQTSPLPGCPLNPFPSLAEVAIAG